MRLKLKWILTCLVALAVALVVAAYAILSTLEFENLRGVVQAEVKAATGRDFVIAGPIELEISFTPAIAMEDITLANASWGSQAEMVQVRRFELEVALLPLLSGEIRVRRLVVFDPDVLLETDKAGRGNWVMTRGGERAETTKDTTATGAPTLPDIDTMLVENGSVTFRDGETGEEIRFRASEMTTRETDDAVPVEIFIEGAYDEHPLTVEGAVGTFRQFMGDKVYPVRLSVSAGNAEVDVEGSIARPMSGQGIDLQVEVTGKDLAELGAVAGAVLPAVGPYDLAVQIAQDGETTYRLTGLAANVGSSDISGSATVALDGPRPKLSGSFTSEKLGLADFTPDGEGQQKTEPTENGGQRFVFTETPLPLDALDLVDVEAKLGVKELALPGDLTLTDLELSLALEGGALSVKPFSVSLADGRFAGELSLDASKRTPLLAVELTARDVDYGRLLKKQQITKDVTGTLDANVSLRGAGSSPREIAAGLDGRVEVIGDQGSVRDEYLDTAGGGLAQIFTAMHGNDEDLVLNCLVARLPIEGGVATSEAILVDTRVAILVGTGAIDLRDESLDLRLTSKTKEASLMSLAVPFLIGGTLKSPFVIPDPVGTVAGAAKVAGMFINPLVVGALLELESGDTDQNPCVAALDGGSRASDSAPQTSKPEPEPESGGIVEGIGEGISKGWKSIFGD